MSDDGRGSPKGTPGSTGDGPDRHVPEPAARDLQDAPPMRAFDDRIDSTFTVYRSDADPVEVRLTGLEVTSTGRESDWRRFSLYFDGPEGDGEDGESVLAQDTYRIDHPAMDPFDASVVPTTTDDPDPVDVRYEAVFNRHVPDAGPDSLVDRVVGSSSRRGFLAKALGVAAGLGLLSSTLGEPVGRASAAASTPFIGSIQMVGFSFAPSAWALCDGQTIPISQNTALFSLLGTEYGGDGRSTFAFPDMRGRVPIHQGDAPGLSPRPVGATGGRESVSLSAAQLPTHTHRLPASDQAGDARTPVGNTLARQGSARGTTPASPAYTTDGETGKMGPAMTNEDMNGEGHDNMPPFTTVNFIIALQGIFPSR